MKKNKIFISIASYRDPELLPTLKDLISKAKSPQNLVFGISREYHPDDKFDRLTKYKKDKRFNIIETLWEDSLGVCRARHNIQKLYSGEEFYFQLDSHHRFVKDWDDKLKKTLRSLVKKVIKNLFYLHTYLLMNQKPKKNLSSLMYGELILIGSCPKVLFLFFQKV